MARWCLQKNTILTEGNVVDHQRVVADIVLTFLKVLKVINRRNSPLVFRFYVLGCPSWDSFFLWSFESYSVYLGMYQNTPSELEFRARCEHLGKTVVKATEYQNKYEHIDFFVDGISIDVKDEKKRNRYDKAITEELIWLEFKNVKGNVGWLCSNVQKIAFKIKEFFYVFDRKTLLKFCDEFIKDRNVYRAIGEKEPRKLYQRPGKQDLISFLNLQDIIHLLEYKI